MVNIRNAFAFATVALVATVSAFEEDSHRSLQAVNFRQELLDSINAARKEEGLDELCINEMLMDAAQVQANDMADNNFIKSTGSDGSQPKDRAAEQGFMAAQVTEVVGAGYRSASSIVAAWVKSASAKSTLLSKNNVMGPGYAFDKTKKYVHFWAVDFSTGECGNGTATGGATSTEGSGSVELPKSSDASGSVEAPSSESGSESAPASGSGSAPAPAPASGSADAPAVTPAPAAASGSDASGSDEAPAAIPAPAAGTPATAAGTPAPAAGTPAPAAGTPAPAGASGSDDELPANGSAEAPATEAPATEQPEADTSNQ
ncbi:unnamed protein product [Phytophthora lilii]|uniref:Unnamed protein product n=1 Tax=Phytophthora lilii TaxID=2077276 RepID=A0A9W6TDL5_9STRA|nr:unnamed protein product [Phytophthora lilii]